MSQQQIQPREPIENAAEQQLQRMPGRLDAPAPHGAVQNRHAIDQSRHLAEGSWVQVDRHLKRLCTLPEDVVLGSVVVAAEGDSKPGGLSVS